MNKKLIRKMLTAAGGSLQLTPEELKYLEWSKMTPKQQLTYRINRAKTHLLSGPNITNFWEAFQTYIGNRDPKNPHLITGEVPNPGMRNPKLIVQTVQKAKSIALRAAQISDKIFDKQYLKAINSGVSKRILAVRDLHFKAKTGINNPYIFLHATDAKFNQFDVDRTGQNFISDLSLRNGKGIYLTLYSKDYEGTPEIIAKSPDLYGNNVMPLRAYFRNPEKTEHTYHIISSPNYDGYIYSGKDIIGEAFIRNPKLLKSAYSITYDDAGNIIPISLRDNFLINDIRYKQGGKMNILEFLKNGSGIHIKEKNKGKFTSYCGGKVTDECILKGKNSSNPAIRKRATFAANVRKWKHKEGGIIKAAAGTQVNTDTTSKKFDWNSALSTGVDFIGQMLPSFIGGNSSSLQIPDTSNAMTDTTLLYLLLLQQQAQAISDLDTVLKSQYDPLNPNANGGDIVRKHYNWLLTSAKKGLDAEAEKKKKDLIDTLVANLKANTIGSLLLTGLGLVSNYIGNKKGSSVS